LSYYEETALTKAITYLVKIGHFTPEFVIAMTHSEREDYIVEVDDIMRRQARAAESATKSKKRR
jgi:hypothetical protein